MSPYIHFGRSVNQIRDFALGSALVLHCAFLMKKILSILLTLTVFAASVSEAVVYMSFKINQSAIIQSFCINKNAPEKKCLGKCFLNERLAENEAGENIPNSSSIFEENIEINFFPNIFLIGKTELPEYDKGKNFAFQNMISENYFPSLFRPPQAV